MPIEGTLTGWFELVDASRFGDKIEHIVKALNEIKTRFPDCELGEITYSNPDENGLLMHFDATWWEVSPPTFTDIFSDLIPILEEGQYILIEAKLRFGAKARTLWSILITDNGVFSTSGGETLDKLLREQNDFANAAVNMESIEVVEAEKFDLNVEEKTDPNGL